jgi:hypothetical protein
MFTKLHWLIYKKILNSLKFLLLWASITFSHQECHNYGVAHLVGSIFFSERFFQLFFFLSFLLFFFLFELFFWVSLSTIFQQSVIILCCKNSLYCTTLVQLTIFDKTYTITKNQQFSFCMMLKEKNEFNFLLNF